MFAHVQDGQIVALGHHPDVEWDGERWWDLRDPDVRTARGWLEVTEVDRPADTDTHTHESTIELVDGVPVGLGRRALGVAALFLAGRNSRSSNEDDPPPPS